MKASMQKCDLKNWGLFSLRLAVGIIFVYHGWGKLSNMDQTIGMFAVMNFPLPTLVAYLVAFVEFLGGLAVLLGYQLRFASKLLAIVMIVALLTVHVKGPFASAELPIALLGATLALACVGGGSCQIAPNKECFAWADFAKGCDNCSCGKGKK